MGIEVLSNQLAAYLGVSDETSLLIPIKLHLREVLRRIGYELTCDEVVTEFKISGGKIKKDSCIVSVVDISRDGKNFCGVRVGNSQNPRDKSVIPFKENVNDIVFIRDSERNGSIFVKYYAFFKDEDGLDSISDSIYVACESYLKYRLLDSRPMHPDYRNRMIKKSESDVAIDSARSELLNSFSPSSYRARRRI